MDGLLAIAIEPSYISKSGKKTPHIGTFWSGCASTMKHGLEIMGLALVDVFANSCMMLRAHQTPSTGELKLRNMTLVQHYIAVIKRYKKDLLKVTDIVVADAFFSIRPFVNGIKEHDQLDFSYNASFASQNVAKVMMKENGVPYSMASFKELMASTYIARMYY